MIRLALRTFADRWQLFVGTLLAVTAGVAIVHAGLTIILGVENADAPTSLTPEQAEAFRQAATDASQLTGIALMIGIFLTIFVVGSTFSFAVDQRRGDLAILRLGGVTRRQIRRLLLGEAFLAALLGALAGALLGTVLTTVQRTLLSRARLLPRRPRHPHPTRSPGGRPDRRPHGLPRRRPGCSQERHQSQSPGCAAPQQR
jgi:putative ABC transport system permease protein